MYTLLALLEILAIFTCPIWIMAISEYQRGKEERRAWEEAQKKSLWNAKASPESERVAQWIDEKNKKQECTFPFVRPDQKPPKKEFPEQPSPFLLNLDEKEEAKPYPCGLLAEPKDIQTAERSLRALYSLSSYIDVQTRPFIDHVDELSEAVISEDPNLSFLCDLPDLSDETKTNIKTRVILLFPYLNSKEI